MNSSRSKCLSAAIMDFCLSSAYTVRSYILQRRVPKSRLTVKYHNISSDEVWKEEEVSSGDDSDCRPGVSAPTRRAPGLYVE